MLGNNTMKQLKAKNEFKEGKHKISYVGSNFESVFSEMKFTPSKRKLYTKILEKPMNDKKILETLKPTECTLGDVVNALDGNQLLTNGYANIFYVRDTQNTLWAVDAFWDVGGWHVLADSVEFPYEWDDGRRVFSCDSFSPLSTLNSSDPLNLELRLKSLEEDMSKIKKFLII